MGRRQAGKSVSITSYDSIYTQISNREMQIDRRPLKLIKTNALKNSVQCMKIEQDNYLLMYFLRSAFVTLDNFNRRLKNKCI